jgi:hypothetical protein
MGQNFNKDCFWNYLVQGRLVVGSEIILRARETPENPTKFNLELFHSMYENKR